MYHIKTAGTTDTLYQITKAGPQLKKNVSALEIRNSDDSATGQIIFNRQTESALVASTTQSQGEAVIPAGTEVANVATVANANDVVTLPAAAAGRTITVINNGANILQIFPAASDKIDAALADASTTLASGYRLALRAYDATSWVSVDQTARIGAASGLATLTASSLLTYSQRPDQVATIGTVGNADYVDVQAMITAGYYQGRLVTDVTEDSDITLNVNGLYLDLNNHTLTMGSYRILESVDSVLTIVGKDIDKSILSYAASSSNDCCDITSCRFLNFTYSNTSSANGTALLAHTGSTKDLFAENLILSIPDGLTVTTIYDCVGLIISSRSIINNIRIHCNGTKAQGGLGITNGIASNILVTGSAGEKTIFISGGCLSRVSFNASHTTTENIIYLLADSTVMISGIDSTPKIYNANSGDAYSVMISDIYQSSGYVDLGAYNRFYINNLVASQLDMSDSSCSYHKIVNSNFGAAVTVGGNYNMFNNCTFNALVTVSGTRNRFNNCTLVDGISIGAPTLLTGCQAGASAGGGAATITVTAGTGTVLNGCITDDAIADSGTDTVITGCVVY